MIVHLDFCMIDCAQSKGQLIIPAEIRKKLSIESGDKLAVYASDDVIMLKPIRMPTVEDFMKSMNEVQAWVASVGYQESDINNLIKGARQNKHL